MAWREKLQYECRCVDRDAESGKSWNNMRLTARVRSGVVRCQGGGTTGSCKCASFSSTWVGLNFESCMRVIVHDALPQSRKLSNISGIAIQIMSDEILNAVFIPHRKTLYVLPAQTVSVRTNHQIVQLNSQPMLLRQKRRYHPILP